MQEATVQYFDEASALSRVLDPNVVVHAEDGKGRIRKIHDARTWAKTAAVFARTQGASVELALVGGRPGLILAPEGRLTGVLQGTFAGDALVRIDVISNVERLDALDIGALA